MIDDNELRATWPDAKKIICKDCFLRDRTQIEIDGDKIAVGVTRCYCLAYPDGDSNGKPHEILFNGAKCRFYQKG